MIADTTFLIDLHREQTARRKGPATAFLAGHRRSRIHTTIISAGEFAAAFDDVADAIPFIGRFHTFKLHTEAAYTAATIDRLLIQQGGRLGENDTWIAGIARYYGQPLISNDTAFDRVPGLRRVAY